MPRFSCLSFPSFPPSQLVCNPHGCRRALSFATNLPTTLSSHCPLLALASPHTALTSTPITTQLICNHHGVREGEQHADGHCHSQRQDLRRLGRLRGLPGAASPSSPTLAPLLRSLPHSSCTYALILPSPYSSFSTITASGRESNTPTGIVICNVKISVDSGISEVYLGRPSPLTQPPVPPIPPSPPPSSPFSSFSTITASGRESNTPTGIVIRNAKISVDSGVSEVYLGRPWKECARTVFVDSYMPAELERDGWSTWGGDSKGSCVYYAEKGSTGPGNAASRASWVHPGIISDASQFDPEPFVDLSSWLDVAGQNPKW
ncbi:unnamed protein product [Closterium sp. Naga37s-1]|nr:unnamed protein product [Closterium sp. Naga37s-1]